MELTPSDLDSSRFGLRIGRVSLAPGRSVPSDLVASFRASGLDVLVIRHDAADVTVTDQLTRQLGHDDTRLLHADTLVHSAGSTAATTARPLPAGYEVLDGEPGPTEVEHAVRDMFADYTNHYAANPRTPAGLVVDGYVQWAVHHLGRDDAAVHVLAADDGVAALAAVTYDDRGVEIDLAGVVAAHRRRGLYQHLLDLVSTRAADRGVERVSISTQVHNLPPRRAWAQRGWLPTEAQQTLHLVRDVAEA